MSMRARKLHVLIMAFGINSLMAIYFDQAIAASRSCPEGVALKNESDLLAACLYCDKPEFLNLTRSLIGSRQVTRIREEDHEYVINLKNKYGEPRSAVERAVVVDKVHCELDIKAQD